MRLAAAEAKIAQLGRKSTQSKASAQPAGMISLPHGLELPGELAHFRPGIERSLLILERGVDEDGDGDAVYETATWRRAVALAIECAREFQAGHDTQAPAPGIGRGPDGSIDVLWMHGSRKLTINVPADEAEPPAFHCYDRMADDDDFYGLFRSSRDKAWIIEWLIG